MARRRLEGHRARKERPVEVGCRASVRSGRSFAGFRGGDEGEVLTVDVEAQRAEVLFDGQKEPVRVALRHLCVVVPAAQRSMVEGSLYADDSQERSGRPWARSGSRSRSSSPGRRRSRARSEGSPGSGLGATTALLGGSLRDRVAALGADAPTVSYKMPRWRLRGGYQDGTSAESFSPRRLLKGADEASSLNSATIGQPSPGVWRQLQGSPGSAGSVLLRQAQRRGDAADEEERRHQALVEALDVCVGALNAGLRVSQTMHVCQYPPGGHGQMDAALKGMLLSEQTYGEWQTAVGTMQKAAELGGRALEFAVAKDRGQVVPVPVESVGYWPGGVRSLSPSAAMRSHSVPVSQHPAAVDGFFRPAPPIGPWFVRPQVVEPGPPRPVFGALPRFPFTGLWAHEGPAGLST